MKEAIEAVIKELEKSKAKYPGEDRIAGRNEGKDYAIELLKGVLSDADNPSERIPTDAERTE